uniref:Legume lectin domain-containing protein n=1 Tax=Oryza rufipogon TaxID=4529 RepID=A0A0E0QDT8_ORYRU
MVDLKRALPENITVGFSASIGSAYEQHQLTSWYFKSSSSFEQKLAAKDCDDVGFEEEVRDGRKIAKREQNGLVNAATGAASARQDDLPTSNGRRCAVDSNVSKDKVIKVKRNMIPVQHISTETPNKMRQRAAKDYVEVVSLLLQQEKPISTQY